VNAYALAYAAYQAAGHGDFLDDLSLHLQHGYVVSTPTGFGMARPIDSSWRGDNERLADIRQSDAGGDAWFIWMVAGDLAEVMEFLPSRKKWLAFARRGLPRWVKTEKILRYEVARQFRSRERAGTRESPSAEEL
jgi:hypothetical protein